MRSHSGIGIGEQAAAALAELAECLRGLVLLVRRVIAGAQHHAALAGDHRHAPCRAGASGRRPASGGCTGTRAVSLMWPDLWLMRTSSAGTSSEISTRLTPSLMAPPHSSRASAKRGRSARPSARFRRMESPLRTRSGSAPRPRGSRWTATAGALRSRYSCLRCRRCHPAPTPASDVQLPWSAGSSSCCGEVLSRRRFCACSRRRRVDRPPNSSKNSGPKILRRVGEAQTAALFGDDARGAWR